MSGNEKYCSNCCKNIEASKFFLHERMCSINVKKCPKCNKPFTIEDLEDHINEEHGEAECEFCKKKYPKLELEKHKKKCDHKMVPCSFCELEVLLGELKEHQKSCGAITEPCALCGRYIQRKDMENHIIQGCPPPKNDRRSVDVIHNSNNKLSLNSNTNNINYNYYPINDFIYEDFFNEDNKAKIDIKMHNNHNKPNLQIRPASGKKLLNENAKKNILGNNYSSKTNNLNLINDNKKDDINNIISNNNKKEDKNNVISNNNKNSTNKIPTNTKYGKSNLNQKKSNKDNKNYNNYMNKQNNEKGAIPLKPNKNNSISDNPRYNNIKSSGKNTSKPAFAHNLSKGSLNNNLKTSKNKNSDEEFRKSREKFTFQNAKNLEKVHLNDEIKKIQKLNNHKGIINDEDYIANFNFGEVDDQLMQQAIEQSLKEQIKK